ncbi:MAG: DUF805 domain-containing protein [Chitinophagaceae bacterium]|nr:DUF805 domain-containing protein [Chitinophagaceae bacterium]
MEKHESDYNIIDWWKKVVFKNYANFTGRARRAEYWYYVLFNCILAILVFILISYLSYLPDAFFSGVIFVVVIAGMALIVPTLAVIVRRLHDINKSGWYYFFRFIPLVGPILMLIGLFTDGDRYRNQ